MNGMVCKYYPVLPFSLSAIGIATDTGLVAKACRRMSGKPGPQALPYNLYGQTHHYQNSEDQQRTDSIRVQTAYTYDHASRVTAIDQGYNGAAAKRIANYEYKCTETAPKAL